MLSSRVALRAVQLRGLRAFSSTAKPPQDTPATKKEGEVEYVKPMYATKARHDQTKDEHRFQNAGDQGVAPTKWQRRFLIWTKIYKKPDEIPETVSHHTMNRMHDRMRVLFIIYGTVGFFLFAYIFERYNSNRINRDRQSGVVVTKMP